MLVMVLGIVTLARLEQPENQIVANNGEAIWEIEADQAVAGTQCAVANADDAVSDRHVRQRVT